ncbi:MAG: class I SAM-dependent methyltransferase [Rhizonema sp. PD38]|nr:class I SAM-dependent methyltransferase [Rhizonema sp. PD38]
MNQQLDFRILCDPKVESVLNRLYYEANKQRWKLIFYYLPKLPGLFMGKGIQWSRTKTEFFSDKYIPIERDQGQLIYLLARSINAKTIVEFGTSYGISTIYLATAVRDNGGGLVIGTEIVPEKIVQARKNVTEAGLAEFVEILEGDALNTLKDLNYTIDMVLIDGWVNLALDVLQILDSHIRKGGIVLSDNVGTFKEDFRVYAEYLQNQANGYRSATLDLKGGTELSVKVR